MIGSKFTVDENIINNELKNLNNTLDEQRQLKKTLLLYLEKISEGIYNANDPKDDNSLISCLNSIQKSFDNIKKNINEIIDLKKYLENILKSTSNEQYSFDEYNSKYMKLFAKISEDNIFYYSFMESLLKYMEVVFPENLPPIPIFEKDENIIFENKEIFKNDKNVENIENIKEENSYIPETETQNLLDKTLLISIENQTAILPYSISELELLFLNNKEMYSSMQEIVDKKFTISLNKFKNASFSRFRETFNLAKKSKIPFLQTINLANELFFNTNLNPVIIRACKNIDELDIYLSCLENNCLNDFKCFNIIYI